jgi:hypothetical protein
MRRNILDDKRFSSAAAKRASQHREPTHRPAAPSNDEEILFSSGELFADGNILELVAGGSPLGKPDLLLWNGTRAHVDRRVLYRGRTYEAPESDRALYRAMRLPMGCRGYGSVRRLFEDIRDLFVRRLGLPIREAGLLACFSMGTWLADRLPNALNLMMCGSDEEGGVDVLRLLSCVCRHGLLLSELTPDAFRALPAQPSLTFLLDQHRVKPAMQRVLRASNHRGLYLSGRAGLVDRYGPKAIFCANDSEMDALGRVAVQIHLPPLSLTSLPLDEREQNDIAGHFQPRLLMYRLRNAAKLGQADVDLSSFTLAMRPLARTIAMCFPGNPKLATEAVRLLLPQNEEHLARRFLDPRCAIVDILLAATHKGKQADLMVEQLTTQVNSLLRSRGERVEYSAEEVGWQLRDLQIPRRTTSAGRLIVLNRDNSKRLHSLARSFELLMEGAEGCLDCSNAQIIEAKYVM